MSHSVYKINFETGEQTILYECIEDINKAELLAQLAMSRKKNCNDLIFITPGWNKGIDKNPELYNRAISLEEQYKYCG